MIIDNFDSFTYNLVQQVEEILEIRPEVIRNNELHEELYKRFDYFILSPGPGIPEEAGNLLSFIRNLPENKKLLGVCLGHQAIAEVYGGKLELLESVYHGIAHDVIPTTNDKLFAQLPSKFLAARYHSWQVQKDVPSTLEITCLDEENRVMGIRHKKRPVFGIQFHPESILTPNGTEIMTNFLNQ